MIDPIHSLAFSIQANRGVYAVLFGSGISRSAKFPRAGKSHLTLCGSSLRWREKTAVRSRTSGIGQKYEREPDYSELLDAVAKTPAERQ